jgi:5-methylcytosine-specific restriction endonuclease McrA
MGRPALPTPDKTCPVCGATFNRKRFNGVLEDRSRYMARTHCSQACGNSRAEVVKTTHHWRAQAHKQATCERCGTSSGLHVHHVDRNPANNEPANLRTLCGSCHLKLHWREDRASRVAAARAAGARTSQRSTAGNSS